MVINTENNDMYNSETSSNSASSNNNSNSNDKKNNTNHNSNTIKCVVKIGEYLGLSIQKWTK